MKTPGIVIFVAILDFISVSFVAVVGLIALMGLVFGNVMGLYDMISSQMSQYTQSPNFTYGFAFILACALLVCSLIAGFFITLGICLLKGKRLAWYFQVAMCVIGLFGFPFGTVVNGVILFLFFRNNVREYFKV